VNRSLEDWSDEALLEEYRYLTGDLSDVDPGRPEVAQISEEMQRRGLSFPTVPSSFREFEERDSGDADVFSDPPPIPPA
jgi:hypothetical protein